MNARDVATGVRIRVRVSVCGRAVVCVRVCVCVCTYGGRFAYGTCEIDNRNTFKEIDKYAYSSVRVCNANL